MAVTDLRINDLVETTERVGVWIKEIRAVLETGDPNRVIAVGDSTNITAEHLVTSLNYVWAWNDAVKRALEAVVDGADVRFTILPETPFPMGGTLGSINGCPRPQPIWGDQCTLKIWDLQWTDHGGTV